MAIFYLFVINYVSEFRNAPCTPSSEGILAGQLADKRNRGRQKSTRQQVRVFVARSAEDRLRSLFSYGTADGYRLAGGWMISCDACARSRPTVRPASRQTALHRKAVAAAGIQRQSTATYKCSSDCVSPPRRYSCVSYTPTIDDAHVRLSSRRVRQPHDIHPVLPPGRDALP